MLSPCSRWLNCCCARLGDHLILRIGAPGTTDCANNLALLDQRDAASRCNHSVERQQVIEMHHIDALLKDLGWATKSGGCSRLVNRDLNGGKHRAIHPL